MYMSGYQFVHVDSYSSARPKARTRRGGTTGTSARKWSASDVLDEATREPDACKHVESPLPPTWLVGSREDVERAGDAWAAVTVTQSKKGERAVRSDAPWLAAGVVSLPKERASEWPEFRDATVAHLRKKYGGRLRGVVEHLDEPHPHLHFYVVPEPGESFGAVHQGYAAKTAARKSGVKAVGSAFVGAMRAMQDEFYERVGAAFGLARTGPRRDRKTRAEWQAEQAEAAVLAAERRLKEQAAQIDAARREAGRIIAAAKVEAPKIVDAAVATEVKRVRAKGAEYFNTARAQIRQERAAARAEAREREAALVQRGKELHAAHVHMQSTSVYQELERVDAKLTDVEQKIKTGQLAEAQKELEKAQKLREGSVKRPGGWQPPKPKPR